MQKIIGNFINSKNSGLLLFNLPTGFGKTYKIIDFIYQNYPQLTSTKNKIFFITPLKKNLAITPLKERFIKDNKQLEFDSQVIEICSNADKLIKNINTV